jgi:16S rRNA (guanine527-N7)-methyltransferase
LALTKKGGILAAYKAKSESIEKEMEEIKSLGLEFSVKKLFVPYLTENSAGKDERERNLVIIKKCE